MDKKNKLSKTVEAEILRLREKINRTKIELQKKDKELEIEAALEKVRARTMAMQKSDELNDVIKIVLEQMQKLGVSMKERSAIIYIFEPGVKDFNQWVASPEHDSTISVHTPFFKNPIHADLWNARVKGAGFYSKSYSQKNKNAFFQYFFEHTDLKNIPEKEKAWLLGNKYYELAVAFGKRSAISLANFSENLITDDVKDIMKRIAKVFEQTFTRFLDLQKAEAQAREAQIEAALERVRAVATGMHKSDDLLSICEIMYQELIKLGFSELRNTMINIYNDDDETFLNYDYSGYAGSTITHYGYHIHPIIEHLVSSTRSVHDAFVPISMTGKELVEWKKFRKKSGEKDDKRLLGLTHLQYYFYSIGLGSIGISTFGLISEDKTALLRRFRNVFYLAYQRYTEILFAETKTREAQIDMALERVRSRTLAMQKSNELAETSVVLFKQLINLGIEPNRLYICVIKDENGNAEFWITDEDGSKVSTGFETNLHHNNVFQKMFEGWRSKRESLVIEMHGKELQEYFIYLKSLNVPFQVGLSQKRRVQHLAYFSQGFIGMASPEEQPATAVQLLERFAAVFNLTYTRFNDLQIAEAHALQAEQDLIAIKEAKQKAEDALIELQSTQKQLIQSEKMASLGELTAGIAHEIQNPLNFVNNFSDVSNELIEELKNEKAKDKSERDESLEDEILNDIASNLEKIHHHGQRAASIVKGMLQHSRSSSGQKELADINALCDEYLRLAYHGLRAKDKSFNASFETSFDESLEKINIVPQDIGRVVLNLINNAFYAANQKQKIIGQHSVANSFVPTVSVRTKNENNNIVISIKDNGTGIPKDVIDKIFQPFFTTKPTGLGTGLGLSLSYDIIKAHGGEIKVETKEGEGTEFIIIFLNSANDKV